MKTGEQVLPAWPALPALLLGVAVALGVASLLVAGLLFVCLSLLLNSELCCLDVRDHNFSVVDDNVALQETPSLLNHKNFDLLYQYPECGKRRRQLEISFRIFEGSRTLSGQLPWMVQLGEKEGGTIVRFCAGTLITRRYVLTAAHCVDRKANLVARLGEQDAEEDSEEREDVEVERIVTHEMWNSRGTLKHDIALVRLSRDVEFNYNIAPICLPLADDDLLFENNPTYEVAGWGVTDDYLDSTWMASGLLRANLSGKPLSECNLCVDNHNVFCPLTDTQICGQGYKGVDVCKGDSGGPLVKYEGQQHIPYQVGITSFNSGQDCGQQNFPSIFTNVSSYIWWILDNMEDSGTVTWSSMLHYFPLFPP